MHVYGKTANSASGMRVFFAHAHAYMHGERVGYCKCLHQRHYGPPKIDPLRQFLLLWVVTRTMYGCIKWSVMPQIKGLSRTYLPHLQAGSNQVNSQGLQKHPVIGQMSNRKFNGQETTKNLKPAITSYLDLYQTICHILVIVISQARVGYHCYYMRTLVSCNNNEA